MASNVNINITATDKTRGTLQGVQRNLASLDQASSGAASGIGLIGKAIGAIGLVGFGAQVASTSVELARLGAESLALKSSFDQVQGGAGRAAEILISLRQASRGMISDQELMLAANKATLLGVADTAAEMSALLRIAEVRGRAMGLSVSQAFSDIVTGLGRMSPLILDNLGITVDLATATERYAQTLGKTAKELSDAERKQALVNAVLESSAPLLDNANAAATRLANEGFTRLAVAWENFKTSVGEGIAPTLDAAAGMAADALNAVTLDSAERAVRDLLAKRMEFRDPMAAMGGAENAIPAPFRDAESRFGTLQTALQQAIAAQARGVEGAQAWVNELTLLANEAVRFGTVSDRAIGTVAQLLATMSQSQSTQSMAEYIAAVGAASDTARPAIQQTEQAVSEFTRSFESAATILREADDKMRRIYSTLLDSGDIEKAGAAYSRIQAVVQEITAEWVRQGVPVDVITNDLVPKLLAELDALVGAQMEEAGTAGKAAGADIADGFLSSIPAIQAVIAAVNDLTGAAAAAGAAYIRATQVGGLTRRLPSRRPPAGLAGRDNPFYIPPTMGRQSDGGVMQSALSGISGLLQRLPFAAAAARPTAAAVGGGGGGDSGLDRLAGRVQSVLSGALKSGIDVAALLPREDAIEEPARRLADIAVRGFDSPWTEYIRTTFPKIWSELESSGDPKGTAAAILRDFEAGLRPELLDKNRAKDLVRRALTGEANMAALAQEIAAELAAEMGVSLESAQAAAQNVLGVSSSGAAAGTAFGDGVAAGVKDTNAGGRAVAALVAQLGIKDNLTAVYDAGKTHGAQYGTGFLAGVAANVPGGLVAILVAAVTPGVMASINTGASRTGAQGGMPT